jgi:glucose dehydrogenase
MFTRTRSVLALGVLLASALPALPLYAQDSDALANAAQNSDWLTYGHDYAETRFSTLDQINDSNVGELGLAWTFDTDSFR